MAPRYRLGVDVGGTHTDLVLLDTASGALIVEKVSTTPGNPALGVLDGLARLVARGVNPQDIAFFAHGTTITTNALLEMRGAKVGLLVTAGFRAVQEVQTQARDGNLFDYFYEKPPPIAPQSLTREIRERSDAEGRVLVPLDAQSVRRAAHELAAAGVQSIAVCYLFSYMNPRHEQETRRLVLEEFPRAHISLSSEVLPRIREWPRMSTTLVNAYLEPVLIHYIGHLNSGLDSAGLETRQRFLMQSNGGVMPFSWAIAGGRTVHTLFSGPAAGAQASAYLTAKDAVGGLVTLDIGGTSADIAFIEGGVALETTEGTIARRQIDVPALDMTSISAGGGSIAAVAGASVTVGPQSAGADPGPACYGRGGNRPTVTDADLVCGLLNPDNFLGGAQKLDSAAAHDAIHTHIAEPLGMSVHAATAGIRRIVDLRMADEIRVFAARRGVNLAAFTLLPFGGAGAVHATAVAEELGMARILVPPRPGAFSALGLLCTDVVHDYIRSELRPLAQLDPAHVEANFRQLETQARGELAAEGLAPEHARVSRELDMRYMGQGYELRVSLEGLLAGTFDIGALRRARERFDAEHARIHGHAAKDRPVEIVSYRVRARVDVPKYVPRAEAPGKRVGEASTCGSRKVYFDGKNSIDTAIYHREALEPGMKLRGPAIVEQFDATTVLPPGWLAEADSFGNLLLTRQARR